VIHRILVYGFPPGNTEKLLKQTFKFDIIFLKPKYFEKLQMDIVFSALYSFLFSEEGRGNSHK